MTAEKAVYDCWMEVSVNKKILQGKMEAIIFAGGDPVSLDRIAQVLEINLALAEELFENLQGKYNNETSGIQLIRLENDVQMCSNPAFIDIVREALQLKKNAPLSQASLEVLAVVAYNQPVTKAFVEQVRGVDCSGVVGSLVKKGLLEEKGRMELPGRPLLYGTTEHFLRCLNIMSLSDLPEPNKAVPDLTAENIEADAEIKQGNHVVQMSL